MNGTHTIAFPGFGLSFEVDPVAFTLFGLEIKWYGVIITVGILCALLLFYRYAKKVEGLPEDHLYNLALFTIPLAIIGARFVSVATKWDQYKGSISDIINIRQGGLAIYGWIIFGALTIFVYTRITKLSTLKVMDAVAPAVMVGQIIGRWGNFVNAEAYGDSANVETLFCRMVITDAYGRTVVCHPTFLYESLWNLVGVLLLCLIFYRHKKFDGEIICLYVGWYGFGRTFIEFLRTDSLYLIGDLKFSVFVGICSVILCIVGLLLLSKRAKRRKAGATYTAKFRSASVETVGESPEAAVEESPENEDVRDE